MAVHPNNKEKTTFSAGIMVFINSRLGNAPVIFECLMWLVLRGLASQNCLVYLDYIIMMGKDFNENLSNLKEVFTLLRNAYIKFH